MYLSFDRWRRLALPLLLATSLSACALGRSQIDVPGPVAIEPTTATPGRGFAKIVAINDLRVFEAHPSDAGTPSLENDDEITDKSITTRAVARKRSGYGMALGDVVLPPGKTVADLVRAAARKALQDKGYTVVEPSSPTYAAAQPLEIDINQYWAWMSPGFATITVRFKARVTVRSASLILPDPRPIESFITDNEIILTDGTWSDIVRDGNNDLSDRIREHVNPAP